MYYGLRLFDFIGILNEQDHIEHLQHSVDNLENVTKFSDLYSPGADIFFDWLWANALAVRNRKIFKYTPIRKAVYIQGTILIPLVFCLFSYLFYCFTG
jgi:small-conductance mechanosensitive channel